MIAPQIFTALDDIGPMSAYELGRLLDAAPEEVTSGVNQLKQSGKLFVCRFDPVGKRQVAVFSIGAGKDVVPMPLKFKTIDTCLRKNEAAAREVGMWAGLLR